MTPVSNATQTISRLQSLLIGFKNEPTAELLNIFEKCTENPIEAIKERVDKMSKCFIDAYTAEESNSENDNSRSITKNKNGILSNSEQSIDFAERRLKFAITFYYKMLELIAKRESKMIVNNNYEI